MALPVRKGYKGAPAQAVLTNSPTSGDTTFVVDTITGWATTFPFYCVVEPGTSREEKVKVTAISTLTLTVVRAQDDTTASGHNAGAAIYPVFTADEADEANLIASVMTTKGDVIGTDGSSINRLGVGTNTHVLQADSTATNGFKWGQVATAGIADSAVTSAKILDLTIVAGDIATDAVTTAKIANLNVTTAKIADLGVTTGKIADSAVTSAKIADSTIVLGDLAAALQAFLIPVGTINAYGNATPPTGWLLCNGQSTSGYTTLASVVGATVPDLRGRTIIGTGTGTGLTARTINATGGTETHALTTAELASHSHEMDPHSHTGATDEYATSTNMRVVGVVGTSTLYNTMAGYDSGSYVDYVGARFPQHSHTFTTNTADPLVQNTGSGTAHNNMQPFYALNYIIKHD